MCTLQTAGKMDIFYEYTFAWFVDISGKFINILAEKLSTRPGGAEQQPITPPLMQFCNVKKSRVCCCIIFFYH